MRAEIFSLCLAGLCLASCSTTSVTTGYYEVSGSSNRQLDKSIAANGPMGGHAFAATQIRIRPVVLEEKVGPDGCRVSRARFKVNADITMPRWSDRKGASDDLKQGFDIFADYARVHEQMHVRIGEAAARTMEAEVLEIAPQKDCDRLANKVSSVVTHVLKRHNKAQLAFDAAEDRRLKALFAQARRK